MIELILLGALGVSWVLVVASSYRVWRHTKRYKRGVPWERWP